MKAAQLLCGLLLTACATSPPLISSQVVTPLGAGSCFPISDTEFLTAWHVVSKSPAHTICIDGLTPTSVTRLGDLDAALLSFSEPHGFTPWPLDVRQVEPLEEITLSGWGARHHWWVKGHGTTDADRLSLSIAPGDSGGPIISQDGKVLGIVVGRGFLAEHHCWIVPITQIAIHLPSKSR